MVSDLLSTGLTQPQLAALVPCSQALISAYLNGRRGANISKKIGDRLTELHQERIGAVVEAEVQAGGAAAASGEGA